ncbi:MAG: hypothetical protein ACTHWH_06765 [Marinobacter sp.]
MISFLENLLQRHQPELQSPPGGNLASNPASYIVQPRPQSRFESDQEAFAPQFDGTRNDERLRPVPAETESDLSPVQRAVENRSPSATDEVRPRQSAAATLGDNKEFGHGRSEGANGHLDAAVRVFDQTPFEHAPQEQQRVQPKTVSNHSPASAEGSRAVANQSFPQPIDLHGALSQEPATHEDSSHHAEDDNALNRRIETVLQAILSGSDHQPVQTDEQQSPVNPGGHRVLPRMVNQTASDAKGQASTPEPVSEPHEPRHQPEQVGSLQIPDWLADIQTELHSRWREINSREESEPVVNVTIGRVEVRAVQDKPAKQAKARKRPSGVMTLEAYLKQRDRRGQV